MYNQQQQQNYVPFPVDQFTANFVNIPDFNRPPVLPAGIVSVQWMQNYIPYTISCLIAKIQDNANNGAISLMFFNMMSSNGWNNSEFYSVIQDAVDYIFLQNQEYVPHQQDIYNRVVPNCVAEYLDMRSLYCVKQWPALWQYINQNDQGFIQQQHYQFEGIMQRIQNMRNDTGGGNIGQPVGRSHQAFTQGGQSVIHNGPTNQYIRGGGNNNDRRGGGRDFAVPETAQAQQNTMKPPFESKGAPVQTQQQQPSNELIEPSKAVWRAPENIGYPPAYNPLKKQLLYQVINGITNPKLKDINMQDMIDFDRHNIASLLGKPPAGSTVVADNSSIESGLVKAIKSENVEADATAGDIDAKHITKKSVLCELSLEQAIRSARAELLVYEERPRVFHAYADVYLPIISDKDESEIIRNFAKSGSYIELREKIKSSGDEASMELLHEVNLRMTAHMNHMLHHRLSIHPAELTVDDFVEDLDELLSILKTGKSYGERVLNAFLANQKVEINALFLTIDPSDADQTDLYDVLTENVLGDIWADRQAKPAVNYIGQTYQLTFLDVISHDLQVGGIKGVGNGLVVDFQPVLTELAAKVLNNPDELGIPAHYLIITKDGRILEVSKGNLAKDFHVVSVVK